MINLALMKIGARIHENDKIGNSTNEVLATVRLLKDGGANVVAFTKVLDSDNKNTSFPIKPYEDFYREINEFDKLIIINGNVNFFGGQYSHDVEIYRAINSFPKEVIYFMYDPYLGIKQIYKSVLGKSWGSSYTRDELEIKNKLHYITQCRNILKIKEVGQKSIQYYPLELFPLVTEDNNFTEVDFNSAIYDLNYAGTFRGGRREQSMIKFYFGLPEDIRVQMFGNLKLDQFKRDINIRGRAPEFGAAVTHDKVRENILKGLSTVIIGDPLYCELDDIAQRFAESIIFGQITFIDADYDRNSRAYHNKDLESYLRVYSKDELIEKLREIKNNKDLFYKLLKYQREDLLLNFDSKKYCRDLVNMIELIKD